MNIEYIGVNWVDLLIVIILIYFVAQALTHGFWVVFADFFAFLGALLIALLGYKYTAELLHTFLPISSPLSNALGFLLTAIVVEAVLGFVFGHLVKLFPSGVREKVSNRYLAIIPALGTGLVLVAFILLLATALPISPKVKVGISNSRLGSVILARTTNIEKLTRNIFNGVVEDSLTHLIVRPGSKETVQLDIEKLTLSVDQESEIEMVRLLNRERDIRGLTSLTVSSEATEVARQYANNMWNKKYFGHISPEGLDVGDRLEAVDYEYEFAGENLALSPTVSIAHNGLMNSEGHRANILEEGFFNIGIGVVDNDVYGKIFVQVFTD